jgi:aconitate hydratase
MGLENGIVPQQDLTLVIKRGDGSSQNVPVKLRLDTPIEIEYYQAGGILPYVLNQLLA